MKEQCTECGEYLIKTTGSTYCPNAGKHQHKKPQMMICPKKDGFCDRTCSFALPHEYIEGCEVFEGKLEGCPACIEYVEPSPDPRDGNEAQEFVNEKIYPEPMPLISDSEIRAIFNDNEIYCDHFQKILEAQRDADMAWFKAHCKACVDMGKIMELPEAHDQQVRKAVIDEIDKLMELEKCDDTVMAYFNAYYWIDKDEWEEFKQAHLRAMAGER